MTAGGFSHSKTGNYQPTCPSLSDCQSIDYDEFFNTAFFSRVTTNKSGAAEAFEEEKRIKNNKGAFTLQVRACVRRCALAHALDFSVRA